MVYIRMKQVTHATAEPTYVHTATRVHTHTQHVASQETSLYCIQTNGVNRFVIDTARCRPPGTAPPPAPLPATPLGALLQGAAAATPGPPPVPPPTPAEATTNKAQADGPTDALKQLLSAVRGVQGGDWQRCMKQQQEMYNKRRRTDVCLRRVGQGCVCTYYQRWFPPC